MWTLFAFYVSDQTYFTFSESFTQKKKNTEHQYVGMFSFQPNRENKVN